MDAMQEREQVLPVARGERPADMLLRGGRVVNVFSGEVESANVAICGRRVAGVGDYREGREIVDVSGAVIVPGFIDAHVHIESSMLTPQEFARAVIPHGTTCVIADPHEIANVLGMRGIQFMLDSAARSPLNVRIMLPSCVPATNLETAGAELAAGDLAEMMQDERVGGLGEMMNYPGAICGDAGVMAKLRLADGKRIDGHAPGIVGKSLQAYAATGISTDHESTTLDEAREKLRRGLRVLIREGSAAHNLAALAPLVNAENAHRFCFCTDDRHPDDLVNEGHIDHVVRLAMLAGMPAVRAIQLATLFPAEHYGLRDRGAVAPGFVADMVVLDGLEQPCVKMTWLGGKLVAKDGAYVGGTQANLPNGHDAIALPGGFGAATFRVGSPEGTARMRVIQIEDGQLTTGCGFVRPTVRGGLVVTHEGEDVLKLAVIERHRGSGHVGIGFVKGFGLKRGALASTVAHDSHNLLVVGTNDEDMAVAARAVAEAGGGQAAVQDGNVLALLPLPIAGLMSDEGVAVVVRQQTELRTAAASLGSQLRDPFMPLSFLSLPVIPRLKLTDRGLVDVDTFAIVPLFESAATAG